MATAPTTSHRPTMPADVMSRFVRTTLPLALTFLVGSTVIGAIVYLVYV